ncbi:tRNA (adenosine(37)-N6)-dimethylallyltransferase MiaA [Marininema halotolerans]|uniref:tRNA dimethylallyltransferase n=1 Tax=Marininema halotolerans TaxID=1155944 RepID=A0A1I6R6L6_9BACL|nr:tRNA (adenosine(37)-N6)-dimethylallyltransferase MiaA [Marininema halotolerans]SFS60381.1 tRNA dimethylallyltransferase [Marininema halotolerans]
MPLASKNVGGDLLVIVGPTSVGKTALSLELAHEFAGEIISGDSMQVYRYMDIGTAKATPEERAQVPHHLIDLKDPDEAFSVDEFQRLARQTITQVQGKDHLPMIVGGTGLYIQSVTHGYQLPDVKEDPVFRAEMNQWADEKGHEALHQLLARKDEQAAARLHPNDRRRVIRALEIIKESGKTLAEVQQRGPSPYRMIWIGLTMPRERLYDRINQRVEQMMEEGLLEEVMRLREMGYTREHTSMQALGYKELMLYLEGECRLEKAVDLIQQGTRKYAKRQLSWFRRLPEIHWVDVSEKGFAREIHRHVAGKFPLYKE